MQAKIPTLLSGALVIASLKVFAVAHAQASDSTHQLPSFQKVLAASLKQSLATKRALLEKDQATVDRSLLGFDALPKFGLDATWVQREPESTSTQTRDQTYSAQLTYNVFDFGRTRALKRAADARVEASERGVEEANEDLTWDVARSYLAMITAAKILDISRENLNLSRAKFSTIRSNYERGLRPETDLISAEADLGNVQLAFDKAEADLMILKRQLQRYAGDTPLFSGGDTASITHATSFLYKNPSIWSGLVRGWKSGASSASQRRREAERKSLGESETAAAAVYRPRLDLALTAQQAGTWEKLDEQYSGQLQLSWDLPWPGALRDTRRKVSLQRSIIENAEAVEMDLRREQELLANDKISTQSRLWNAIDSQLKLRTRQYDLTKRRYEAGKATAFELSNSELELGNTRVERIRIASALVSAVLDMAEVRRIQDLSVIFN